MLNCPSAVQANKAARRSRPGQFSVLLFFVPALIECGEARPNANLDGAGPTLVLDADPKPSDGKGTESDTAAEPDFTSGPEAGDAPLTSDAGLEVLDSSVDLDQSGADGSSAEIDTGPPACLCDDGNSCSVDGCDEQGACTHSFLPEGAKCTTPGGGCMVAGTCKSNFCTDGGSSLFSQDIEGQPGAALGLVDGYAIAGAKDGQTWLLRLDLAGQKMWEGTYGGGAIKGKAGALALYAESNHFLVAGPGYLYEVDAQGKLTTGTSSVLGDFQAIDRTAQGFVFTTTGCLATADAKGKVAWNSCGPGYQTSTAVKALTDGYAILGKVGAKSGLYRTGGDGKKLWVREFPDGNLTGMAALADGFALAGTKGLNRWLVRTDASGYPIWEQTYPGTASTITATSIVAIAGGNGFALFGTSHIAPGVLPDTWLLRTDKNGAPHWDRPYGSIGNDYAAGLLQLADGFVLLANRTGTGWMGRVDSWGNAVCVQSGACFSKAVEACADGNPCTYDHCAPAGNCQHPNVPAGASCGKGETCTAGACSP